MLFVPHPTKSLPKMSPKNRDEADFVTKVLGSLFSVIKVETYFEKNSQFYKNIA